MFCFDELNVLFRGLKAFSVAWTFFLRPSHKYIAIFDHCFTFKILQFWSSDPWYWYWILVDLECWIRICIEKIMQIYNTGLNLFFLPKTLVLKIFTFEIYSSFAMIIDHCNVFTKNIWKKGIYKNRFFIVVLIIIYESCWKTWWQQFLQRKNGEPWRGIYERSNRRGEEISHCPVSSSYVLGSRPSDPWVSHHILFHLLLLPPPPPTPFSFKGFMRVPYP